MGCCCWLYRTPQVLGSVPGPVTGEVPAFAGGPEIGPYVAGLYLIVVCGRGGGTGASVCPTTGRAGTRHSGCDGGSGGGLPYMVSWHRSGCKRCKTGERRVKRCSAVITLLSNGVSRWSFCQGVLAIAVFGLEWDEVQPASLTLGTFCPTDFSRMMGSPAMHCETTSCYYYHVSTSRTPERESPVYCPRMPVIEKPLRQLIFLVLVTPTPLVQVLCPKYRLHINYAFIALASFLCLLISDHS